VRAVIQRVSQASVSVAGERIAEIGKGLVVLVCAMDDQELDCRRWADRLTALRVFPGTDGKMTLNISEAGGALLLISQFTLAADMNKGHRPSFGRATKPDRARLQLEELARACRALHPDVSTGAFGEDMALQLTNDGPVTLFIDR
jgi:D-tyrosyl-tRNA(Tyr) deacylase